MLYCVNALCRVIVYKIVYKAAITNNQCPTCREVGNDVEPMMQISLEQNADSGE